MRYPTTILLLSVLLGAVLGLSDLHAALIPPSKTFPESTIQTRIRVRLAGSEPRVRARGYDLRIQPDGQAQAIGSAVPEWRKLYGQTSEWEFRCHGGRVSAISQQGQDFELRSPVTLSSPSGMVRIKSRPYRDMIRIYAEGSSCEVVNELDIEKYLTGLVNAEFSSQWNEEAVGAQVIAARTYALYQIRSARERRTGSHYDVDATTKDQVYDGYFSEDFRASRAVEKTRGQVLVARGPGAPGLLQPIKAFYHASCAGTTELPENVWGSHFSGFNHGVTCPFCSRSEKISWNFDIGARDIQNSFIHGASISGRQKSWPLDWRSIIRHGTLTDVRGGALDAARRRTQVLTVWLYQGGQIVLPVRGVIFREWLGATRLKSTAFDVYKESYGRWHIAGRGNGHGVGMCQLGAKFLGENGYKTAVILKHYYPDAILTRLW